jgi:AP endonuclease-1
MARKTAAVKRDRSTSSPLSDVDAAPAPAKSATNGAVRGRASKAAGIAKSAAALQDDSDSLSDEDHVPKKKLRASAASTGRGSRVKKETKEAEDVHDEDRCGSCASDSDEEPVKAKGRGKAKSAATKAAKAASTKGQKAANGDDVAAGEDKPKKKPKAKAFPPPDLDPASHPERHGYPVFQLPELTVPPNGGIGDRALNPTRPMLLGAHVSIGGGPAGALLRAGKAGANGLAMFVKSQRQWKSNPYEEEAVQNFKQMMKSREDGGMGYGPESVLVHGSYLINLGYVTRFRCLCQSMVFEPEMWLTYQKSR